MKKSSRLNSTRNISDAPNFSPIPIENQIFERRKISFV